jgi:hypothetical protein
MRFRKEGGGNNCCSRKTNPVKPTVIEHIMDDGFLFDFGVHVANFRSQCDGRIFICPVRDVSITGRPGSPVLIVAAGNAKRDERGDQHQKSANSAEQWWNGWFHGACGLTPQLTGRAQGWSAWK